MKNNRWTYEYVLYGLAVCLALVIRFYRLGAPALTDYEAGWANQALNVARGQAVNLGPQPFYVLWTAFLFNILGSANWVARALPALTGSMLVLLPVFFRHRVGQVVTLTAAFGLALDPLLVASSRTVGENMPAIAFTLLALGALLNSQPILAGVLAGLALLSGPALLPGILALALTWGILRLLRGRMGTALPIPEINLAQPGGEAQKKYLPLFVLVGSALFFGTSFFRNPQGLAALAATLPAYLGGWGTSSGIPLLRMLTALAIYQPLAVIFGVVTLVRSWVRSLERSALGRELSVWAVVVLLVVLAYPARQVSDLTWVVVPLWFLAAFELVRNFEVKGGIQARRVSLGQAVLIFLLVVFSWFNLLGFNQGVVLTRFIKLNSAIVLLGTLFMSAITILLVSIGWSWGVARRGLAWALLSLLGVYTLAGVWGSTLVNRGDRTELWERQPAILEADLLQKSLRDTSEWVTGQDEALDMVVLINSPALRWLLRDWRGAQYLSSLPEGELPEVIIAYQSQDTPRLTEIYRGQDFAWGTYPAWEGILPADFVRWLAFRKAPTQAAQLILWVRGDILPGAETFLQDQTQPNP